MQELKSDTTDNPMTRNDQDSYLLIVSGTPAQNQRQPEDSLVTPKTKRKNEKVI